MRRRVGRALALFWSAATAVLLLLASFVVVGAWSWRILADRKGGG